MKAWLLLVAMASVAHAQQMVCEPCVRGDDTLKQLGDQGTVLRESGPALVRVGVRPGGQLDENEDRNLDAILGSGRAALAAKLAPLSDAELADAAAAVCNSPSDACEVTLAATLGCLAGRCEVRREQQVMRREEPICDPIVKQVTSPRFGLGLDWGEGRQDDRYPVDGRAWSFGFEGRVRLGSRLGVVGRLDRSSGRDASIDQNGDGRDDVATGPVTRVSVLAGPSMLFAVRHGDATRFAQLDLLGGYLWTLSQPGENGPAAGFDLSYSLEVARAGVRVTQGFGDAKDARAVLAHVGFVVGAGPSFSYPSGCGRDDKDPSNVALALDIPLFGYGLTSSLYYSVPGFGMEGAYHASKLVDVLAHGDLIVFPGGDRERTVYQTVLAGARLDFLGKSPDSTTRKGFFTTLMAGYAWAAGVEPTTAGSGPVAEASVGWGAEGDDGMVYLRLHGRFGLTSDNVDAAAVFLSSGIELRLDRRRWSDRL